jgi:ABC-type amino acid transport substrate-binding protein
VPERGKMRLWSSHLASLLVYWAAATHDADAMADVFISYKREDRERAEALARFLEQRSYSVWWDTSLQAGEAFTDVIKHEIDQATKVVVLWSTDAVASFWVRAEAARAMEQKKLVAARLDDCDLPLPFTEIHTATIKTSPDDFEQLLGPLKASTMVPRKGRDGTRPKQPFRAVRLWWAAAILLTVAIGYAVREMARGPVPAWQLSRTTFIGEPIPLQWSYAASTGVPVSFEIEYDTDDRFSSPEKRSFYTEGRQRPVQHVNGPRYWRLRAVVDRDKRPISDWNSALRITQYDSAYRRIETTSAVIIGVSDTDYDDLFKWKDGKGWHGFEIALTEAVVAELSARVGWRLDRKIVPFPWADLLNQPPLGQADMIVSAISRRADREAKYKLSFSEAYYCTTQALLYGVGEPDRPIAEMIAGRRVGYEDNTTSKDLVQQMNAGHRFTSRNFARPETMLAAILNKDIDFAVRRSVCGRYPTQHPTTSSEPVGVQAVQGHGFPRLVSAAGAARRICDCGPRGRRVAAADQ